MIFENLDVWKESQNLAVDVYNIFQQLCRIQSSIPNRYRNRIY